VAPCWFGVVANAHAAPFHVIDSVVFPGAGDANPTAEQDVELKQSILCRWFVSVPGFGLATMLQAEPFHISVSDL
jgi:hypothetical protein